MRAGKAYISSFGTTGVLVASSLVLLTVVGALVAFDRWPNQAIAEPVTVPVARDAPDAISRSAVPVRASAAGGVARAATVAGTVSAMRGAALSAGRVGRLSAAVPLADGSPVDPVISDLPAPDTATDPSAPTQATASPATGVSGAAGTAPPTITVPTGTIAPSGGDGLGEATTQLGDTLGDLGPGLSAAVRSTGSTADGAVADLLSVAARVR